MNAPYVAVVKGIVGAGKTAFIKHTIFDLQKLPLFQKLDKISGKKVDPVFASTLNADTFLLFLNIWRPIL